MEVLTDEPKQLARDVQRAVLDRTRLWCSIGVGDNKLRAKIASDMAKPQGVFRLTAENWHARDGRTSAARALGHRTRRVRSAWKASASGPWASSRRGR